MTEEKKRERERVERNGQWRGEGNKMGQRFGKGETDEGVMNHHVIRKIESLATGGSPRSFNKQTPFTQPNMDAGQSQTMCTNRDAAFNPTFVKYKWASVHPTHNPMQPLAL